MALIKVISCAFFLISLSSATIRKITLAELATKQHASNLRFLSKDGSFTYYQRRSGSLLLSTNYTVKEVIKGKIGSQYFLYSSPARKKIIILQNDNFHTYYSIRNPKNIFQIDFGKTSAKKIGQGISPTLHLNDKWITYYKPYRRSIVLRNLANPSNKFTIKINNKVNRYFIPQVVMLNNDKILFTDLSSDGFPRLNLLKKNSKKLYKIYKSTNKSVKLELCLNQEYLVLGEFGTNRNIYGSFISTIPRVNFHITNRKIIYESSKNDIGHIQCNLSKDIVYFIKNITNETGKEIFEASALNLKKGNTVILSDVKTASQLIAMDGLLLLPHHGKYFVLIGESDFTKKDLLRKK